jgi:hypothetical protein
MNGDDREECFWARVHQTTVDNNSGLTIRCSTGQHAGASLSRTDPTPEVLGYAGIERP